MTKKQISIALLVLIALAFVALFWRGCGPKSEIRNPKSEIVTVTVPAVDNPPVVAPPTVAVPVPEPAPPAIQRELDHYRNRYEHYKRLSTRQGQRLAALDSLLAVGTLSCEEKERLLLAKLAEHELGGADAAALIDQLNDELAPRRDSGSAETADYRFAWQLDHFGSILPGGFVYDIDVKEREVQCPECPTSPKVRRRSLAGLYGMGWDGRPIYAAEARTAILKGRVELIGLVGWDGQPLGLGGVAWRW
jgi:hypothetical protein